MIVTRIVAVLLGPGGIGGRDGTCLQRPLDTRANNRQIAATCSLRCERTFVSEGPHHRLCQACREFLAVGPTPVEDYPIGSGLVRP